MIERVRASESQRVLMGLSTANFSLSSFQEYNMNISSHIHQRVAENAILNIYVKNVSSLSSVWNKPIEVSLLLRLDMPVMKPQQ